MAKIIKITESSIYIGMEDGSFQEVRPSDLNFSPQVGDEVEVYTSETQTIVQKKAAPETKIPDGGIPINVSNEQTTPQTVPVGGTVVNKWAYCLLALFLGGVGGHKFYAGRVGAGICYLLFCWTTIPAIIAFVELIIALSKHADPSGNIVV